MPQPARQSSADLLGNLIDAWRQFGPGGRRQQRLAISPYLHEEELDGLRRHIADCLSGRGGEVAARLRAAQLGETYLTFNDEGRRKFLSLLAAEFGHDDAAIDAAARELLRAEGPGARARALAALGAQLKAPQARLLTQLNDLPQGTRFLVELRADLLRFKRSSPALAPLDDALCELLTSWFDVGFLQLQRITWQAPAALLEKLIEYEAVHRFDDWRHLKRRLGRDRRCFAFFHPRMADEPLIFVWVALTADLPQSVGELLDPGAQSIEPGEALVAVFYSISNTQVGLQGVSLGNFLIKRVVDSLHEELPRLTQFATLSPVIGFREYLMHHLPTENGIALSDAERAALQALDGEESPAELLASGRWLAREDWAAVARAPLLRLCAHYLIRERRLGDNAVLNPVAHFHLSNGARLTRINWLADRSENGLRQCYGLMVNYIYRHDEIATNHEHYVVHGTVAVSTDVEQLLQSY